MTKPLSIGVFAPSSCVEKADIDAAAALLKDKGHRVFIHPQTFARHHQSAGIHAEKLDALYSLLGNLDIDIIWAAGGGNRCLHWIDDIDFERVKANPKPIIGFSDVTALLNAMTAYAEQKTYHGPVFKTLSRYQELDHLLGLLDGKESSYSFDQSHIIHQGKAKGRLFGGNLSVFQYFPQTLPDDFLNGAIVFLEDCNEELSRIDRMLLYLKRLGVFDNAAGLIFGEFTDLVETGTPFGFTLEDIIREHTDGLNIPIIMNAPFGHGKNLCAFPIGQTATLDTTTQPPALILQNE